MPLTSAQKNANRKEAQAKLGRKRREQYLTDGEWKSVKELINNLRCLTEGDKGYLR